MITYPGTWKTVLILSHELDTNRTLFLLLTDVSFWDVNPAAEQTLLKDSGFVWDSSVCFKNTGWSSSFGLYASSPATTVMSLCLESELNSILLWGIGGMEKGTLGYCARCWFLWFILLDLSCINNSSLCDFFLPFRQQEWQMAYSSFYHSSNPSSSPHVLQQTLWINGLYWSPSLTPK